MDAEHINSSEKDVESRWWMLQNVKWNAEHQKYDKQFNDDANEIQT
jgi:hypothetical protein